MQAGEHVDERDADLVRRPVLRAGDRHQPALGLGHEVVSRPAGRLAARAEAGDRAVDDARVARAHLLVADPEPVGAADLEVLDHRVGARAQLEGERAPLLLREVDRARALAAVDRQVVGRLPAGERRPPGARLVTARGPLDLDHLGAEVGEHHRAVGPGEHPREVDHAHAASSWLQGCGPVSSSRTGILTGAGLAVAALEQAGVEMAFGLPGVHNLALWRALGESPIRLVGVRHEQTAAYAADGYARATGRLGVALTTTGPGAANTLGGRRRGLGLAPARAGDRDRHPHRSCAAPGSGAECCTRRPTRRRCSSRWSRRPSGARGAASVGHVVASAAAHALAAPRARCTWRSRPTCSARRSTSRRELRARRAARPQPTRTRARPRRAS